MLKPTHSKDIWQNPEQQFCSEWCTSIGGRKWEIPATIRQKCTTTYFLYSSLPAPGSSCHPFEKSCSWTIRVRQIWWFYKVWCDTNENRSEVCYIKFCLLLNNLVHSKETESHWLNIKWRVKFSLNWLRNGGKKKRKEKKEPVVTAPCHSCHHCKVWFRGCHDWK